jgi:hypothetical protein
MDGHGHKIRIEDGSRNSHDSDAADNAKEGKEPVADLPDTIAGDQGSKDRNINGHAAELEGENFPAVVFIVDKPKLLLKQLAGHKDQGEHAHHLPVSGSIMLGGKELADDDRHQHHLHKAENMKPTEHTGANFIQCDIAPGPINKELHSILLLFNRFP